MNQRRPYFLRIVDGPEKGREFELSEGKKLVVGRGTASDTQINDPRVSRVHCEVELRNGQTQITANASAGQTLVRGKAIQEDSLHVGEVFRIGDTFLRLDHGDAPLDQSTMISNPMEALVGQNFAHYRIDKLIAQGRTGVVYRATDTEKDRVAAVKVLLPTASSSDEQRERFVRAMRTMLPIRHPNIIRLYHAGKQGKFCWVAMEYVDGESMREVIARLGIRDMLDWRKVWEVAVDIGQALQHASEQKIVHRNLSPANIISRKADHVNLLGDLMLAKATEGNQSFDVTAPGQLLGELSYMSPERTRSADIDVRSDIYELGATLYALMTGRPPVEANSQIEHIDKIRNHVPPSPREYQLAVNEIFAGIVMTMLEKRPEDRHQTADELLSELQRVGTFAGLKPR